ncbi:MAG: AraC family transcriptional regulator [Myxococcales bacterium FL481]|nr:MAG: AraC family transcriptional regulator [Myxococcales bacterium FL481]
MKVAEYTDFDAFSSAVRDANFEMLIQNPKRQLWSVTQMDLHGIHIQMGQEGSGNITEGETLPDGHLLFMPLTHAEAHSANGVALDDVSVAILAPKTDFCLASRTEHDWFSIFVPTLHLDPFSAPGDASSKTLRPRCRVTRLDRQLANRYRASVVDLLATSANYPEFESSLASTVAAEELRKLITEIFVQRQAGDTPPVGRQRIPRRRIIRCCHELLEAHSGEHIGIKDLAVAAGVCERTLRTAFREHYGIGPARYLQLRTLHRVRRALRAADPEEVSVATVLLRHGEWEFGRFAARYRRVFGELPSQTLRYRRAVVQAPALLAPS